MTHVCLVGKDDVDVRIDIFSYETARHALATYDVSEPWRNTLQLRTNSLGNAVSLLNDLNWYLVRLTRDAIIKEPSVSNTEWLSRPLAKQLRDGDLDPDESINRLKVYGVENDHLVDPTYVLRGDAQEGTYERADYDESVVVRVTQDEFF